MIEFKIEIPEGYEKDEFSITLDEARVLNFLLRVHAGLLRQSEKEYEQILRLINGLGTFVDKHDKR